MTPGNDDLKPFLRDRARVLSRPSDAIGFAMMAFIVWYGYVSASVSFEEFTPVLWALLAVTVVMAPLTLWISGLQLRQLRRAAREEQPSTEMLLEVAREASRLPNNKLFTSLLVWGLGAAASFFLAQLIPPGASSFVASRQLIPTLIVAPLAGVLIHIVLTLRGRALIAGLLERGLSQDRLLEALPPTSGLRTHVFVFSAVLSITPATLMVDGAVHILLAEGASGSYVTMSALGLVALLVVVLSGHFGAKVLLQPLRALTLQSARVASGDLRRSELVCAEHELWAVSAGFGTLQRHLSEALAGMQRAGIQLSSSTEQMLSIAQRNQRGATTQASNVHETSATTEELARVARRIADHASAVSRRAEETLAAAQGGHERSRTFITAMQRMRDEHGAVARSVGELSGHLKQIGRVVEFITGVADKVDLLALNAALEGTKAGEVGRGFSLVASEMRRLAENVTLSTREISNLMAAIRRSTEEAVTATDTGLAATEEGAAVADEVTAALASILEQATETARAAAEINAATMDQQTSADQLAEAMISVLQTSEETATSTRQVNHSSAELASLARDLKGMVERFAVE